MTKFEKMDRMTGGACERLENEFEAGQMLRLVSEGYPPSDYPINRGNWFEVADVLRALDGSLYIREQSIYTGTAFPSRAPVYWEARLARAPRADI